MSQSFGFIHKTQFSLHTLHASHTSHRFLLVGIWHTWTVWWLFVSICKLFLTLWLWILFILCFAHVCKSVLLPFTLSVFMDSLPLSVYIMCFWFPVCTTNLIPWDKYTMSPQRWQGIQSSAEPQLLCCGFLKLSWSQSLQTDQTPKSSLLVQMCLSLIWFHAVLMLKHNLLTLRLWRTAVI